MMRDKKKKRRWLAGLLAISFMLNTWTGSAWAELNVKAASGTGVVVSDAENTAEEMKGESKEEQNLKKQLQEIADQNKLVWKTE